MFTHLHTHSDYSFLDALPQVKELAKKAVEMNHTHLALTDRGNMHGAIEFYKACKGEGIQPILGLEAFIAPRSRHDKEAGIDAKRTRIVLLAKNNTGYENLLKLVSISYQEGFYYVPRIDFELLKENSSDLFCILCRAGGPITPFIETNDLEKAHAELAKYQDIFQNDDLFLETTPRPNQENEKEFQRNFHQFTKEKNLNIIVSNDLKYLEKDDADTHDTLICMQYSLQKDDHDRISFKEHDMSFWSEDQMREYFPELSNAVDNTQKIAEQCSYEFDFSTNLIPQFSIPSNCETDSDLLKFYCEEGIRKRFGGTLRAPRLCAENLQETLENIDISPIKREETNLEEEEFREIIERMDFELETIGDMGFNAYFLIVGDFVIWAKENGIAVGPGRGSAAGAIVAYLLEITDLNPLKYGLFFERFLNPERVSMPDIDIDFADTGREEVLEYVRDKYGRDCVANVCTFGTMAAKASIKDVGRAFGVPFSDMNAFAKLIPDRPGTKLKDAIVESSELREDLEENEEHKKIYDTALKIEGNTRHISVHACAVMITPEPIIKYCPLQPAPKDPNTLITQYQAKPLEMLGLLKMDFLGLRNLSILENTMKLIKKRHQIEIDILEIPMDAPEAFKILTEGFTTGVFQLESAGMTRYLKELKPTQFEDLIAMVSLYRPGPMKFIPDYIGGKHGTKKVKYADISLENILKETFGIAIYQEQILEIAKVFAGFTLGGADILRRAIGKKIQSELDAQRQKFIDGSIANGHKEKTAVHIFDEVIVPFAGYGFNKSHAACYALIAYQTAYLKSLYPVEFMTALLMSDAENTDRVILDIEECRGLEIEVLPPSVLESEQTFSIIDEKTIRFGLNAIKGIGDAVVDGIVQARNDGGFENFADFLGKCGSKVINKKSIEALAKAGALKDLEKTENILEHTDQVLLFTKDNSVKVSAAQDDLFGAFDIDIEVADIKFEPTDDYSFAKTLNLEKEVLGIYVSDHPLRGMKAYFEKTSTPIKKLPSKVRFSPDKKGKCQGMITSWRKLMTKKGDAMAIGTLEDTTGKLDIVLFPKSYASFGEKIDGDSFLKIEGKMDKREGAWQMMVDKAEIHTLDAIRKDAKEKKLLNENETSFVDTEQFEEELENTEGISIDGIDTGSDTDIHEIKTWEIELEENINPEKIAKLKSLILATPIGNTEITIHFRGQTIPIKRAVEKSEELIKKVEEILR